MEWIGKVRIALRKVVATFEIAVVYAFAACGAFFLKAYFPTLYASLKDAVYAYAMKRANIALERADLHPRPISPRQWNEIVRDGHHMVVSVKAAGEVEVIHLRARTVFTIYGVPAEFCRMYEKF